MEGEQRGMAYALTEEEQRMIQSTWAEVCDSREAAGVEAFIRVFTNFPASTQYFNDFRDMKDMKEIEESGLLNKHALRVVTGLGTLVESIKDGDKFSSMISLMAESHARKHKLRAVFFKILIGAILEVLAELYPHSFGVEVQWAWSKMIDMLYWHITKVYSDIDFASLCE